MSTFVGCNRLSGDVVHVNLDQVRTLEQLKSGATRITFSNGDKLQVQTPPEQIASFAK